MKRIKKIHKVVELIGNSYRDYDVHFTKCYFEVKFSPYHKNTEVNIEDKEVVFVKRDFNFKEEQQGVIYDLLVHLNKIRDQYEGGWVSEDEL